VREWGGGRDACGHDGHITPLAHEHLYLANSSDDRPNTLLTVHAYDDRV
jgi:hypothetical protein